MSPAEVLDRAATLQAERAQDVTEGLEFALQLLSELKEEFLLTRAKDESAGA